MTKQIEYYCKYCGHKCEMEVSYFNGELDDTNPDSCPGCKSSLDDKQIEKEYEEACRDSNIS
jgi:DNA replicative helicase MCM subunit Mcm2 (Cdc46/Mcm family)